MLIDIQRLNDNRIRALIYNSDQELIAKLIFIKKTYSTCSGCAIFQIKSSYTKLHPGIILWEPAERGICDLCQRMQPVIPDLKRMGMTAMECVNLLDYSGKLVVKKKAREGGKR